MNDTEPPVSRAIEPQGREVSPASLRHLATDRQSTRSDLLGAVLSAAEEIERLQDLAYRYAAGLYFLDIISLSQEGPTAKDLVDRSAAHPGDDDWQWAVISAMEDGGPGTRVGRTAFAWEAEVVDGMTLHHAVGSVRSTSGDATNG